MRWLAIISFVFTIGFGILGHAAPRPLGNPRAPIGGNFTIGFSAYPKSLNYYLANEEYALAVNQLILEPLIELSLDTFEPLPRLAKSWTISKDKRLYTFTLSPNARFSDGSTVTAEDVKFTWDTVYNPKHKTAPYQSIWSSFEGVRVVGPAIVEFRVKTVHFQNLEKLADFFILPKAAYAAGDFNKAFNATIVGSGPYQLEKTVPGERIVLGRRSDYWGAQLTQNIGRYNFERILFKVVPDTNVQYEIFKKGDIDYFYFLSAKMWSTETNGTTFQNGYTQKLKGESLFPVATQGIAWNMRRPLFHDHSQRLALSLLLNRERLIREIFYDNYRIATGIVAPTSPYHPSDVLPIPYDPKRAKEVLTQAGWTLGGDGILTKGGLRFAFEMLIDNPSHQRYLTIYQEDLKRQGIQMDIRVQDWAACLKLMDDWQFDAHLIARSRTVHPYNLMDEWGSPQADVKGSGNVFGYKNPMLDALALQVDGAFDAKKRNRLVQQIVKIIATDVPMTPTWEAKFFRIGYWNRFGFPGKGYQRYSTWRDAYQYWWLDTKKADALKTAVAAGAKFGP